MKKIIAVLIVMFSVSNIYSQSLGYSIGVIGSHFHNDSNENKISESNNPYGYGIVISKGLTKEFSIALTGEYLNDNLKNGFGKEKDLRFHFTGLLHPYEFKSIQPYFSGGFVFTHRNIEYNDNIQKSDNSKDIINARLGVGVNVPLMSMLFINGDLGMYTDGYGYVGWGSSLGLRISL